MLKRKGVSKAFEEVMLFMVGVLIFIVFFSIFSTQQLYFTDITEEVQLNNTRDLLVSNIMKIWNSPGNSTVTVRIPTTVGNVPYKITLGAGMTLTGRKSIHSSLYNINATLSGSVWSKEGKVTIIKTENNIKII